MPLILGHLPGAVHPASTNSVLPVNSHWSHSNESHFPALSTPPQPQTGACLTVIGVPILHSPYHSCNSILTLLIICFMSR